MAEIRSGGRRVFEIEARPILLLKYEQDLFALANRCSHLDHPLDNGRQVGFTIICRLHGARFDIRDGRSLSGPAVRSLEIYPVRIVDEQVEIGLPGPAKTISSPL